MATGHVTYAAFLRGINVGGHHKVPMAELRKTMAGMGFTRVTTLLNSGNVLFDASAQDTDVLEAEIARALEARFGFPVPTVVREAQVILDLLARDPFREVTVTKDIRRYITFLKNEPEHTPTLPWTSEDGSFRILEAHGKQVISLLDLAQAGTPKAMAALEGFYGKDITTRNWNTLGRMEKKLVD